QDISHYVYCNLITNLKVFNISYNNDLIIPVYITWKPCSVICSQYQQIINVFPPINHWKILKKFYPNKTKNIIISIIFVLKNMIHNDIIYSILKFYLYDLI